MSDEFKNGTCAPSDCASCGLDCGNTSPESHNTITLTLDDDTEIECAILTVFPVEKQEYIAPVAAGRKWPESEWRGISL